MGNIMKSEKPSKTDAEGLQYRSLFESNNNSERFVKTDGDRVNSLIKMVHENIISRKLILKGPFGRRKCVYMDNTASGQPLKCIEDLIQRHILPYYGNTHTSGTVTSSQTTSYREEAREIVRGSVGATDDDVVIFCGSGATRAIHKLVNVLSLKNQPLVVFVGPYEHHSNILPWREKNAQMIFVPETNAGLFDFEFFEKRLKVEAIKAKKKNRLLIGAFSVASNITGISVDDIKITKLLHKYGALSFWDYSSAASHVEISMNPGDFELTHKDAIYFSGHKLVGGPQTPGVLVAKRFIFEQNRASDGGGGGSVFFVTKDAHLYLKDIEAREEAGTPAIVESVRLGLAFNLKNTIQEENILAIEKSYLNLVMNRWSKVPGIKIMAHNNYPRTSTISFLIQQLDIGLYLHHNFVVALLNDLFGIQTRGGCGCAGPYSQSLLGINSKLAHTYKNLLLDVNHKFCVDARHCSKIESPCEIFKPGFVRVSLSFCSTISDVEYVAEAVEFVARKGFMLLPYYKCNVATGGYFAKDTIRHCNQLKSIVFDSEGLHLKKDPNVEEDSKCPNYDECLQEAENIVNNFRVMCSKLSIEESSVALKSELRWFVCQQEVLDLLRGNKNVTPKIPPFIVSDYDSVDRSELESVTKDSVLDQLRL